MLIALISPARLAAALVVVGLVIVLDPIFQGLVVSMIFGVVVSITPL